MKKTLQKFGAVKVSCPGSDPQALRIDTPECLILCTYKSSPTQYRRSAKASGQSCTGQSPCLGARCQHTRRGPTRRPTGKPHTFHLQSARRTTHPGRGQSKGNSPEHGQRARRRDTTVDR